MADLPPSSGGYLLLLELLQPASIQVGRLGNFEFLPGWYAYAGSACGPGGLRARLGRHRRGIARPHWHIDHLRQHTALRAILFSVGGDHLECTWSQMLAIRTGASTPVSGFGASDCMQGCPAHLAGCPAHQAQLCQPAGWKRCWPRMVGKYTCIRCNPAGLFSFVDSICLRQAVTACYNGIW